MLDSSDKRHNNRPWVTINVAMSADGKTDTFVRQGAAISSDHDFERVDRLRAQQDAILVGGRTVLGDDPRLTVKSAVLRAERVGRGLPENPAKVAILSEATLPPSSRFLTHGPARILIYTSSRTHPTQVEQLNNLGAEVHVLGEHRVDLDAAFAHLYAIGVRNMLVEGGGTLIAALLKHRLVDELYVYMAPLILGGEQSPTFVDGPGFARDAAIPLQLEDVQVQDDGGLLIHYTLS